MRIIAGRFRSRLLISPRGFTTRPMPDRVRESVFAMLGTRIEDAHVADLFAGSGAIGLEAVSRGAASCVFVEQDRAAADVLQRNIDAFGLKSEARVVLGDALGSSIPARLPRPIDLVFLDPPYPLVTQQAGWDRVRGQATRLAGLLADDGFLILRTPWPFLIETPDPLAPPEPASRGRGGRRREDRGERGERGGRRDERGGGRGRRGEEGRETRRSPRPGAPGGSNPLDRRARRREHSDEGEAIEWLHRIDRPDLDPGRVLDPEQARALERIIGRERPAAERPDAEAEAGPEVEGDEQPEGEPAAEGDVRVREKPAATPRTPGDLRIEGLRGPETHAYGSTAVHWYMRAT